MIAGRFISGIREAPVESAAVRLLCRANRNNAGTWSSGVSLHNVVLNPASTVNYFDFSFQEMVDKADPFPCVLRRVVAWMQEKELGTKYKYTLLTDG